MQQGRMEQTEVLIVGAGPCGPCGPYVAQPQRRLQVLGEVCLQQRQQALAQCAVAA